MLEYIEKFRTALKRLNQGPLSWIIKTTLSSIAGFIIYKTVDFEKLIHDIQSAHFGFLLASFGVLLLSKVVSVDRINRYYRAYGIQLNLVTNYKLYFVGLFYNLILPSGFGGDGYKIAWLKQNGHSGDIKSALTATFVDRLNGIQGLFILLSALLLLAPDLNGLKYGLLSVALLGILCAGFVQWKWFQSTRRIQVLSYVHSVLVHGLNIGSLVLNAIAIATVSQIDFAIAFSLSSLAFLFPFFIGGVGSRELALIYLSTHLDIDVEAALFAVFINHVHRMMMALIGLPMMLRQRSLL